MIAKYMNDLASEQIMYYVEVDIEYWACCGLC